MKADQKTIRVIASLKETEDTIDNIVQRIVKGDGVTVTDRLAFAIFEATRGSHCDTYYVKNRKVCVVTSPNGVCVDEFNDWREAINFFFGQN